MSTTSRDSPPPQPSSMPAPPDVPGPAPLALGEFQRTGGRLLSRHFGAVRMSRSQRPNLTAARQRSLLVYFNHASWWDPLVCAQLATHLLPERRHFAIVESATLDSEPLFAHLGFIGAEPESPRGSRRLMEIAGDVLDQPDTALWMAAGGGLADPRERPAKLQPGLGHLAARLRHCVLLPLALEYPFWAGRQPEALSRLGEELAVEDLGMRAPDWLEVLADRLTAVQDKLAAEATLRDPARFEPVLIRGGVGDLGDVGALGDVGDMGEAGDRAALGGLAGDRPASAVRSRGILPAWRRLRELWRGRRRAPGLDTGSGGEAG